MVATVRKWGNSLAIRISKAHAEELGIAAGTVVRISVVEGKLVVQPTRRLRHELGALLRGVTRHNVHRGVETGPPVGREAW